MNRRGFVAGLGSLAMAPALPAQESRRHAGRMKITEVRLVRLKVVRELGILEPAWFPGRPMNFQVGGGAFLEVRTDQGLVGIGPSIDAALLPVVQQVLVARIRSTRSSIMPGCVTRVCARGTTAALTWISLSGTW